MLAELNILDEVRAHDTRMRGTALVDADGTEVGQLPAEVFAGELEIPSPS